MKDHSSETRPQSTSGQRTTGGISFNGSVTFHAPMFDIHDNTNVYIAMPEAAEQPAAGNEAEADCLPEELRTPLAETLRSRLVEAKLVDDGWQPLSLSNAEKGVLASLLADRLEVDNLWQTFSRLWGMNSETLRSAFNKGMDQQRTNDFMERVKNALRGDDIKKNIA